MKKTAVIPGSFDPITVGHLSLVLRASEVFDKVVLHVCNNFDKEYLFTKEERLEIAKSALRGLDGVSVAAHDSWLYEYLLTHKDSVLVKGVRNEKDLEYEKNMAQFNFEKSGVETLFFMSDDSLSSVSSTDVRERIVQGVEWEKFVPQNAQKIVEKFYAEK